MHKQRAVTRAYRVTELQRRMTLRSVNISTRRSSNAVANQFLHRLIASASCKQAKCENERVIEWVSEFLDGRERVRE